MTRLFLPLILATSAILAMNGACAEDDVIVNYRPIIGILAMEKWEGDEYAGSYLAASYVKSVESAGARVVPVLIDQPREYYELLGRSLNGFLFPGGATDLHNTTGFARSARHIYEIVERSNARGEPLALWGTCLGFEMLNVLIAGGSVDRDPRTECQSEDRALPLTPAIPFADLLTTKLFRNMDPDLSSAMIHEPITVNFHHFCVTPQNFTRFNISENYTLITTNMDDNGIKFVSSMEHKRYPIFGTQWHPEKNTFEWNTYSYIPHSQNAIALEQFVSNRFVHHARRNLNQFATIEEEEKYLIYNYSPTYVAKLQDDHIFDQEYLFSDGMVIGD